MADPKRRRLWRWLGRALRGRPAEKTGGGREANTAHELAAA
jgi:hypothetical protein